MKPYVFSYVHIECVQSLLTETNPSISMQLPHGLHVTKAYDQLPIRVPKGRKADIEAFAKERGDSVNGLVNLLLREAMLTSEDEWKRTSEE